MSNALSFLAVVSVLASGVIWKQPERSKRAPRHMPPTEYETLWDTCEIRPSQVFRVDKAVALYLENKGRYKKIERMRKGGVPAAVVFCLHGRESSWSWRHHLHDGSSLKRRTRGVPKGRPKKGKPPFTFYESAEDALYILKSLERVKWDVLDAALYAIEKYNGLGYRRWHKDVKSPYLWAGSNHYRRGKYVADGRFSARAVDRQLGVCVILKRMQQRGVEVGFR